MTNWIDWHGGECPVAPDTRVEVRILYLNACGEGLAENFRWAHRDDHTDIIAYRVIEEAKAESPSDIKEQRDELLAALKPFAAEVPNWTQWAPDGWHPEWHIEDHNPEKAAFTIGDLRRARDLVAKAEGRTP